MYVPSFKELSSEGYRAPCSPLTLANVCKGTVGVFLATIVNWIFWTAFKLPIFFLLDYLCLK